jgi:hypothetical protein
VTGEGPLEAGRTSGSDILRVRAIAGSHSIDLQSFTMSQYEEITQLEGQYLLPTHNRYPVAFERGKGAFRL